MSVEEVPTSNGEKKIGHWLSTNWQWIFSTIGTVVILLAGWSATVGAKLQENNDRMQQQSSLHSSIEMEISALAKKDESLGKEIGELYTYLHKHDIDLAVIRERLGVPRKE